MLHSYLKKYAVSLDEVKYQVNLKDNLDYSSNKIFRDGSYWSTQWFLDYWKALFLAKLRCLGIQIAPGSCLLDCCCGRGYLGEALEAAFESTSIYCDLSQNQLGELISRRKGQPPPYPCAIAGDLLGLPFRDKSFDFVVGNSFLHHLQDIPIALGEINRVIKPGGKAIFFHEPTTSSIFWESFPVSLWKDTRPREDLAGFTDLWMFTSDDLQRLVKQAGFTEVQIFGSGILSAIFLNWYFFISIKYNWCSRIWIYPAYVLKVWLTRLDLSFQWPKAHMSPSIMVVAIK